ncbi:MAG TPA: NTP transferase domain-containing protein [Solirubrobacteraceae bacterium]|nr:NTP transferase domain-containing protein [Solirubrobacteraceae bacterium]
MITPERPPIGVILAGGAGRRLGGGKALASLAGRPLISYPLCAMAAALGDVAVVAKPRTALPAFERRVSVWREPESPSHPLVGIVEALRRAGGRAVVVCAGDMPFVGVDVLRSLAGADVGSAAAVVACDGEGALQPALARYDASGLDVLERALGSDRPLRALIGALGPATLPVDERTLFNVNTPADLERARGMLAGR